MSATATPPGCRGRLLVTAQVSLLLIGFAVIWLIVSGASFFVSGRMTFLRGYFPCVAGVLFLAAGLSLPASSAEDTAWTRFRCRFVAASLALSALLPFVAWSMRCRESLYLWGCATLSLPVLIWVVMESCRLVQILAALAGLPRLRRTAEHSMTAFVYLVIAPLAAVTCAHLINSLSRGRFQPSGLFEVLQYPHLGLVIRMLLLWGLIHWAVVVFSAVVCSWRRLSALVSPSGLADSGARD